MLPNAKNILTFCLLKTNKLIGSDSVLTMIDTPMMQGYRSVFFGTVKLKRSLMQVSGFMRKIYWILHDSNKIPF